MNFRSYITASVIALFAVGVTASAQASTTVITFDDLGDYVAVTNQYAAENVLFGGDTTTLQYPDYNYGGYPYVSYPNVVFSPSDGYIELMPVSGTFSSVGAYASDYYGLTLTAYDASDNPIGSATIGNSYGYSTWISVSAPGIASVQFTGTPGYFTLDNVTVTGGVPEASTWAMMLAGFAGLGFAGLRAPRKTAAVAL